MAGPGDSLPLLVVSQIVTDGVQQFIRRAEEGRVFALETLAGDPGLRARMGEAGRQRVRRQFTFDRFRREVDAVVNEAVSATAR